MNAGKQRDSEGHYEDTMYGQQTTDKAIRQLEEEKKARNAESVVGGSGMLILYYVVDPSKQFTGQEINHLFWRSKILMDRLGVVIICPCIYTW